jgi:hypothetical protein
MSRRILTRGRNRREVTSDCNVIDFTESDDINRDKLEMWLAKQIGTAIAKKYPNRQWGVRVNVQGQLAIITCDDLSLLNGYHLLFNRDTVHDLQLRAVKAAGEVLERFNVSRNIIFDPDIMETVLRDFRGEVISNDARPD